jgi:hypothetical protein
VADDGQGIRSSFLNTSREQDASTPDAAIRLALEPRISSANLRPLSNPYEGRNHKGVGLTVTRIIARETLGRLTIATESGWFDELHGKERRKPTEIFDCPGTIVAVSLHRDNVADYAAMHEQAMAEIGMGTLDTGSMFVD